MMTKGQMLKKLINEMDSINVLPLYIVLWSEFVDDKNGIANSICEYFVNVDRLIVRSSFSGEDSINDSHAGQYKSIVDVNNNTSDLIDAICEVYKSYGVDANEEIIVQPMLRNVIKSGVVFTRDLDTNSEYYIINYQDGSDTTAVTSGTTNGLKTFVSYKYCPGEIEDKDMANLIDIVHRIENHLSNDALDIEFAITGDEARSVYIFQCRPIAKGKKDILKDIDIAPALKRIFLKVQKLSAPHPFLLGHTTCFGVMPDWNPAEILGVRPKKLAISLYKELITDSIWAHQRKNYGYRDLTMHPLMISFCGVPYIDTRITFNSFIPRNLNQIIAEKLVNYYIDMLAEYPKYHDKIEFEIVFSCYYFGLPDKLKKLLDYGFNENELRRIEFSLLDLTNQIIDPNNGLYRADINKINQLEINYDKIESSGISLVDHIYWLIEECKEYGTLPFAGIARAGFIAVQFLRSFVETGIISQDECDAYMNSLNTINKQMNNDLTRYYCGDMSREEFLSVYGHIRPGTYDILSRRYDDAFDEYFPEQSKKTSRRELVTEEEYSFKDEQLSRIQMELDENGLLITADELMSFIKESIEGREKLKFIFTKTVSRILQLVEELGERAEITKDDMAYLDISVVKQLYVDLYSGDISNVFKRNIESNKVQYEQAMRIKLPSIIVKPDDVYYFFQLEEEPNFITQKCVAGSCGIITDRVDTIEGKIVFIQSADPGYDFIFSKGIAGLITQFGGANSHMAIRCAELGIPAVIGVGEAKYNEWRKWNMIELDCLKKQVIRIG